MLQKKTEQAEHKTRLKYSPALLRNSDQESSLSSTFDNLFNINKDHEKLTEK